MKSRLSFLLPGLMILFAIFVWVGPCFAAHPRLKGVYAFTGEAGCLISPGGFTNELTPNDPGSASSNSISVEGLRTFNGDGTGTEEGRSVATTVGDSSPSASTHTFTYSFTYSVHPDGRLTTSLVDGTYHGRFVAGPSIGQTFTIDRLDLKGHALADNKTLTLATPAFINGASSASIETYTFYLGNHQIHQDQRICHRSRVLIWMGPGWAK